MKLNQQIATDLLKHPEFSIEFVAGVHRCSPAHVQRIAEKIGLGRVTIKQPPPWGKTMKAITVMQPYAHLLAFGPKRVENRGWPAWKQMSDSLPAVLLIHAGKAKTWWSDAYGLKQQDVVWGAAVGLGRMVACVPIGELSAWVSRHAPTYDWLLHHEHANGPWCWVFDTIIPLLQPVPMNGSQGIWDCNPKLIEPYAPLCPEHGTPFCGCPKVEAMLAAGGDWP